MSNEKHYPLHPNQSHPPIMTCEIPLEEYESIKRENAELKAKLAEKESDYKSALKAVSHWHDNYCELQKVVDGLQSKLECKEADTRILKRALWTARANAAKFWANYWFDVAPLKHIKYDRIGRMEGVEKEFILTKVTKHMTASDWVRLWEKVERLCLKKAEEYK